MQLSLDRDAARNPAAILPVRRSPLDYTNLAAYLLSGQGRPAYFSSGHPLASRTLQDLNHNHHRTRKLPRHPCFYLNPDSDNLSFSY